MKCMKCGRETEDEQVFCQACLLDMERYPVRPGTLVQLPKRSANNAPRKNPVKRRTVSLEEQIRILRKRQRALTIALVLFALLSAVLVVPAARYYMKDRFQIGQNYSVVSATEPSEETENG